MQAFDQIQELWQKHEVEVKVSADEMLTQAKKEVGGIKLKSALNILGMVVSLLAIVSVWIFFQFQSWTTHVGIGITVLAIFVYTIILYRDYRLIANNDITDHPQKFLNSLKTYQLNRYVLYNKLYWFYTVALSAGLIFYFIEVLSSFSVIQKTIAIGFTFLWILFCSTLVRKSVMKREKQRIDLLIEKFERISGQFFANE